MKKIALFLIFSLALPLTGCSRLPEEGTLDKPLEDTGSYGGTLDGPVTGGFWDLAPAPEYGWEGRDPLPGEDALADYADGELKAVALLAVSEDGETRAFLCLLYGEGEREPSLAVVLTSGGSVSRVKKVLLENYAGSGILSDDGEPFGPGWDYYDANTRAEMDYEVTSLWTKAAARTAGTQYRRLALLGTSGAEYGMYAFLCDLPEGEAAPPGMYVVTLKRTESGGGRFTAVTRLDLASVFDGA